MSKRITLGQSGLIYLRLRGRRFLNMITSSFNRKSKAKDGKRIANAGKAKSGFLMIIGIIYLIGLMFSIAWTGASSLKKVYPDPAMFVQIFAYKFIFQFVFMGLMNLAGRELARTDSDIEWLSSLPAPWPVLLLGKVVERAFLNLWFPILAASLVGAKYAYGMSMGLAVGSSLALLVPVLFASGVLQVLCEYTLRLNLTPNRLRNTQATLAIVSSIPVFLTMTSSSTGNSVWDWALHHAPPFVLNTAIGLSVRVGVDPGLNLWVAGLSYILQILAVFAFSAWGLNRILKRGVVETSQRESSRHLKRKKVREGFHLGELFNPIVRRELTLLARDRNYLVQTFALPILILGAQMYPMINTPIREDAPNFLHSTILFLSLSYMLAFSSFQALNSEGHALWLIFGLPTSLEKMLKQKLLMWISITMVLVVGVIVLMHSGLHLPLTKRQVFHDGAIILGTFTYGWIALALGVFGSNPLANDVQRRLKPSTMIFYMGMVSFFVPVFHLESYWGATVLMILIATLSYALWQEAKDYLPYLLDPESSPPSRVSLAHGSVAVVIFFLLHILATFSLATTLKGFALMLLSYSAAGLIVFGSMWIYFGRKKTRDLPRFVDANWMKNLGLGMLSGGFLGAFGLAYLKLNLKFAWFEMGKVEGVSAEIAVIVLLAVIAAPLFEEYIFRGLVFQGLKRNFPVAFAGIASALIFAAVHPPASFVPVFALGLGVAFLFHKTKSLTASISAHAVYNAIVVTVPLLLPKVFS